MAETDDVERLRQVHRLTLGEARIVAEMYRTGSFAPQPRCKDTSHVLVGRVRSYYGRDVIETIWGKGYRLTEEGRKLFAQALELAA